MRVLVTGAAGFIGFHLCERLLAADVETFGFDAMTPYYDPRLKEARRARLAANANYRHATAALETPDAFAAFAAEAKPDVIVHLGAQAGVRHSLEHPRAYLQSNVDGTFEVLEAARRLKPRHLLIASTSSVYGANAKTPFSETDRADHPLTFYAASKKAVEDMSHSYSHLHGTPTTLFRFFTVYGPWGRPDMAYFKFAEAACEGRPVELYGEGRMARDFTFVDDLVEAILRLIETPPQMGCPVGPMDSLSPAAPWRVVNIAGGAPVGLVDYVDALERAIGRPIERRLAPMQPGDVRATHADPALLMALTGYRPATPLGAGMRAFAEWFAWWRIARERMPV
jgi:UDP-glucuronate 4-epimerase